MKHIHERSGRFATRIWFDPGEIDQIMTDELRRAGFYPTVDKPEVDIEGFLERRLKPVVPDPADLPPGILGETKFEGPKVVALLVARRLFDGAATDKVIERTLRSTLAHEGGHALLHPMLFDRGDESPSLFAVPRRDPEAVLCRDVAAARDKGGKPGGEWFEFQANVAIGALLTPRSVFLAVLDAFLDATGARDSWTTPTGRALVEAHLVERFNVGPQVVRIRLDEVAVPLAGQQRLVAPPRRGGGRPR